MRGKMTMKHKEQYDKIIIGAGLYGLYSAYFCAGRGQRVLVLASDHEYSLEVAYTF